MTGGDISTTVVTAQGTGSMMQGIGAQGPMTEQGYQNAALTSPGQHRTTVPKTSEDWVTTQVDDAIPLGPKVDGMNTLKVLATVDKPHRSLGLLGMVTSEP